MLSTCTKKSHVNNSHRITLWSADDVAVIFTSSTVETRLVHPTMKWRNKNDAHFFSIPKECPECGIWTVRDEKGINPIKYSLPWNERQMR